MSLHHVPTEGIALRALSQIPTYAFWPIVCLSLLVLGGVIRYLRHRFSRTQPDPDKSSNNGPDSTPPQPPIVTATSNGGTPTVSVTPPVALVNLQVLPNREKLLGLAKDRAKTGLCLFCDEPAVAHIPIFAQRHHLGERLFTFFGGITRDEWQVRRERVSAVFADAQEYQQYQSLCSNCAQLMGAQYKDFLASRNAEYSSFALEQRAAFHEYGVYTSLEEMYKKLRAMRMKKDGTNPPTSPTNNS